MDGRWTEESQASQPRPTDSAANLVARLGMQPHPEGGWYVETWRAESSPGLRPACSAILYLLEAGQRSHWHRVDAAEIWQYSAGAALELRIASPSGLEAPVVHSLGAAIDAGETPQVIVPIGWWQAAHALGGWTLVGCIVAPAFEFDGFELGPVDWEPGPQSAPISP